MTDLLAQDVVPLSSSYINRADYREALRDYLIAEYERARIVAGVEFGFCFCRCGEKTTLAEKTHMHSRTIAGYPRRFVPSHHLLASWKTVEDILDENTDKTPGHGPRGDCWLWTGSSFSTGYGRFSMNGKMRRVTHESWSLANNGASVPKGMNICHRCDNPPCRNPSHLFLGTAKDNSDDKRSKDRHAYGAKTRITVITEEQAAEICRRLKRGGETHRAIAESLQIKIHFVDSISRGQTWQKVLNSTQ